MQLFVVATPIGNLKDVSQRALETLQGVDFILCEDTLHSKKLLDSYNIKKPLISYHQHSKLSRVDYIISLLKEGRDLALITDAGTPGIADPGGKLIEEVLRALPEVEVSPIPGASAVAAALSVSGFPCDRFLFLGFPPSKKGRSKFFSEALSAKHTVVFYESPYRIIKTLNELANWTERSSVHSVQPSPLRVVVCRELTKMHETIYRGTINEVIEAISKLVFSPSSKIKKHAPLNKNPKGEFVVVLQKK